MSSVLGIAPVTRIEGHLDVFMTIDLVNGVQTVLDARTKGQMFRGFEQILQGHQPLDAVHLTQRICGVCPISHGMASSLALEQALGGVPPSNGRIVRNLILGANFIQSHILHFYHLAALDYIDTTGILDIAPWVPRYTTPDMVKGAAASTFVQHYVQALAMRRKAHQMGAIFGGKLPCSPVFIPGGASQPVTSAKVTSFRTILTELRSFINNIMLPDVQTVATLYPQYYNIGRGPGNLLAYGVFDLDNSGTNKLLKRGRLTKGALGVVDTTQIKEYVKYSWYTPASGNLNPANGVTQASADKVDAYSWIKAPRYQGAVHEVGPLARMWVNGDYRKGISVIDRLMARALEARKVADAMDGWLSQLSAGGSYTRTLVKASGMGVGLTEAPRGALGHWLQISNSVISRYQIVTPTEWNASPMDDNKIHGALEQALKGVKIADPAKPIEALRVIHSFDPCLSCAVHMATPDGDTRQFVVTP